MIDSEQGKTDKTDETYKTDKTDKTDKNKKEKYSDYENVIRTKCNQIIETAENNGFTNKILGLIYTYIHYIIIFSVAFIFSFNNNIVHLCILLIIVSLDAFSIIVLHGCPLTHLEQKYLHTNTCEERSQLLNNAGIVYTCQHEYEKQVELMINVWTLIAVKCLLLILFKTFNFKLQNHNNIYA